MIKLAAAAAGILVCAVAAHADEWVVEARYDDAAALRSAAAEFQHVVVDRKRSVIRVETSADGVAALERDGLAVTIDQAATARLSAFRSRVEAVRNRLASEGIRSVDGDGYATIPGYQCFRTVEGTYDTMDDLVAAHPDIATIDDIGPTWLATPPNSGGYEMRALRITNLATAASDPDRPRMVVFSSIHAREYAPAEVDTRFAEWLVNHYGSDAEATWLVDHNDFRLVLQANPDGRKVAEQQIYQRKNVDDVAAPCSFQDEFEQPGVDLNRNFPFHWNITQGQGSSGTFCSQTYRGPIKGSEPETANLVHYVEGDCTDAGVCTGGVFADRREGPMNPPGIGGDGGAAAPGDTTGFFVDIHSNAALVLWPWGDTSSPAPNQTALRTLGRRLAWFNGYSPKQSDELYPTDGTTDDTAYGLLGVPAFTIETDGSGFFEDCATFDDDTAPTNIAALRYAARALYAPYRYPAGPDTIDVVSGSDLVVAGDPLTLAAHLDGSRFNQSNGTEPVHDIASAAATVDALPGSSGATPIPLAADDGAFDSPAENASATIDTGGLAAGRHFVYVQGTDTAGNAGTPNAAMIDLVDGASVGTLAGEVTDNATGDPLAATIELHDASSGESHDAASSAATGDYAAHAYPGSYDVRVSAPRHLAETVAALPLAAGATLNRDFALLPDCTILDDDVENGNRDWTAQSPWQIVDGAGGDTTHVWNTPDYGNNLNTSLTTTTAYDLTGYADLTLDFDDRCGTESGYDYGHVEFSTNGGSSWSEIYTCNGQTTWQSHHLELPASANDAGAFKLRFRLDSDVSQNGPGWALDNIRIAAGGDACRGQQPPNDRIFADDFEG